MPTQTPSIALNAGELCAITGFERAPDQLRELLRCGFHRARKGGDGRVILERAHFLAVCAAPSAASEALFPASVARREARKISVTEWAARAYADPPSQAVLGKWRRQEQIHPPPERVGREWYVQANAIRIVDGVPFGYVSLVDRLKR
jgi:hypothetical protein